MRTDREDQPNNSESGRERTDDEAGPQESNSNLSSTQFFVSTLVLLGIYHLVHFGIVLYLEWSVMKGMNNEYVTRAFSDYSGKILALNLQVLVIYLIAWIFHTLLLYPFLQFLHERYTLTLPHRVWISLASFIIVVLAITVRIYVKYPTRLTAPVTGLISSLERSLGLPGSVLFSTVMQDLFACSILSLASFWYVKKFVRSYLKPSYMAYAFIVFGTALPAGILLFATSGSVSGGMPARDAEVQAQISKVPETPNVLLIMNDSLRADHLGINGYHRNTSPAIDRIARQGVNFEKAFTPIASTVESCVSLMSSSYPRNHGLRHMFPSKRQIEKTKEKCIFLADLLERKGYRTTVVSDWVGTNYKRISTGFDHVSLTGTMNFHSLMAEVLLMGHPLVSFYGMNPVGYSICPELKSVSIAPSESKITNRTLRAMSRARQNGEPFFIKAFYSCSHIPYDSPPPYPSLFSDPNYSGPHKKKLRFPDVDDFIKKGLDNSMEPEVKQHIRDLYDGTIREFDAYVRALWTYLKRSGLVKNTIVIITGDHGDDLFEPGTTLGHGVGFEGGNQSNRVPLIMYVPGMKHEKGSYDEIVRTLDVAPTILDVLDMPIPARWEGESLVPYMMDLNRDTGRSFYGETSYLFFRHKIPGETRLSIDPVDKTTVPDPEFNNFLVLKDRYRDWIMKTKEYVLETDHWKLIRSPGKGYTIWRLFNLRKDPHCTKRVEDRYPAVFKKMKQVLNDWIRTGEEVKFLDRRLADIRKNR